MKNKFIKSLILLMVLNFSSLTFAQKGRVGINTSEPKTTMDVNGKKDEAGILLTSDITGFQAPRMTRAELTTKGNSLYGTDQTGAIAYITDITGGDTDGQRQNITDIGYYYFDGNVWVRFQPKADETYCGVVTVSDNDPEYNNFTNPNNPGGIFSPNDQKNPCIIYVTEDGGTWIWNPTSGTYITQAVKTEPWFSTATDQEATSVTENIYHLNRVAINKKSPIAPLDVQGAIRGGHLIAVESEVVGVNSIAVGHNVVASGSGSQAFGYANKSLYSYAFTAGLENTNNSGGSFIAGRLNTMEGGLANAIIGGSNNDVTSTTYSTIAGGYNNKIKATQSFIGGGSGNEIAATAGANNSIFGGANKILAGGNNFVVGSLNTVNPADAGLSSIENFLAGTSNSSTGQGNFLGGHGNTAGGIRNMIFGDVNTITGRSSIVTGARNIVSGQFTSVFGYQNEVSADYSTVFGFNNKNTATQNFVIGRWNGGLIGSVTPLFEIGNGSSDAARKNALTVYKDGKVNVDQLKGTGNAYACIDENGTLFRSATPCN